MGVKKDCFAYKCSNYCAALIEMVCNKRECSFYKTHEQFRLDVARAEELYEKRKQGANNVKARNH